MASDATLNEELECSSRNLITCQIPDGCRTYPPFGADTASWETHRIANALTSIGHQADVISLRSLAGIYPYKHWKSKITATRNRYLNKVLFGLYISRNIQIYSKLRSYNIIHYHAMIPAIFGLQKLASSVCSVVTWGDPFIGSLKEPRNAIDMIRMDHGWQRLVRTISIGAQAYVLEHCNRIITVSKVLKTRIATIFEVSLSKIDVVPPGVDTSAFGERLSSSQLAHHYGITKEDRIIMCPARITPLKSQLDLIRALPSVKSSLGRVKVFFVGHLTDLRYLAILQKTARELFIESSIIFTGTVTAEDFPRYYCMANLVVLPSVAEGLPSSLLEAMSCGRPTIATDIPPNREAAVSGNEIVFVPPNNPKILSESIVAVLNNKDLQIKLSGRGRQTALKFYSWDKVARLTVESYWKALRVS